MKLRKTEEEVVHGRLRGWDPYVCYPLNCSFALMTDFESSRCVITTRQEVRCIGDKSEKVEREPQWMVRSEMSYVDLSSSVLQLYLNRQNFFFTLFAYRSNTFFSPESIINFKNFTTGTIIKGNGSINKLSDSISLFM